MNMEQSILQIPIEDIIPNRFQPRLTFDDKGLEELADSIKQHGIIQPLVLRRVGDKYEIIAGERRYKAATIAGLTTVPAIISNIDDNKSAEVAIVENVQRRDLSVIEEARSYKNLLDKGYLTQSELARKMGLSQSAIANKLRLLNLAEEVQDALLNNKISERHARSLLVLPTKEEQINWLNRVIKERLTVRQLDDLIKKYMDGASEVPLAKTIDIESIKKEASEIPEITEESSIAQKLREIERENLFNPDIVRIDNAQNDSKGNFFNFLENEKVNMNMIETEVVLPKLNMELPNINETKEEETNMYINNNLEVQDNNYFDPVDLIETLDPDYEEKIEEKLGLDLKTAITKIRDVKEELEKKGFLMSLEESDLVDSYQFIIKVKKD
ncbi:MAG: ParB/RepB/Spo0J family partition protein [Firmicutes bacterium]|nr:ParB/RepB/Spo0J family partition protein [Bacillota bacterium]